MCRSLLPRLPRQAPSTVTCNPLRFALPRTYSTWRRKSGGLEGGHFKDIVKRRFPSDFPGETVFVPNTFHIRPEQFSGPGGVYMTRDDDIQKYCINKSYSEVHLAVGGSFTRDIDSFGLPTGMDVHGGRSGALPSATRTVRIRPDPVAKNDEKHLTGEPLLVLAVALSQPRQHLNVAIPRLFESEPSLQKVIAVHADESPAFVSPLVDQSYNDDLLDPHVRSHCDLFNKARADVRKHGVHVLNPLEEVTTSATKDMELKNPSEQYGPVMLHGQEWVGEFTADVQVWHRDSETGASPQSEPVVFYGRNAVSSPDLDISTNDLLVEDGDNKAIQFDWEQWRSDLDLGRMGLATVRYVTAIRYMSRLERIQRFWLERRKARLERKRRFRAAKKSTQ